MRLFVILFAAPALWGALPAYAQMYSPGYAVMGAPMSNFLSSSYLTQGLVNDLSTPKAARPAPAGVSKSASLDSLIVATSGPSATPARLAGHYPPTQRAQAQALFTDLLQRYASLEKQFAIPHGDAGGALAALVAGSWMGLHNATFPDQNFPPLVRQMRTALAAQPGLLESPAADRRDMYDQMAIIAMLLAGTQMGLQQQPDPATQARMREAAAGYLKTLFKVDPERIQLGPAGVTVE